MTSTSPSPSSTSSAPNQNVVRPLEPYETWFAFPRPEDRVVHMQAIAVVNFDGPVESITRDALAKALLDIALRHKMMRTTLRVTSPTAGHLEEIPASDLERCLSDTIHVHSEHHNWNELFHSLANGFAVDYESFPKLWWQLHLTHRPDKKGGSLTFSSDHTWIDGRSYHLFYIELLAALSAIVTGRPLPTYPPHKTDEGVSLQTRKPLERSYWSIFKEIATNIYHSKIAFSVPPTLKGVVPIAQRKSVYNFINLTEAETRGLLRTLKEKNSSLHSALIGIGLKVCKSVYTPNESYTYMKGRSLMDLRHLYKPIPGKDAPDANFKDMMGCHVDAWNMLFTVTNETSQWDLAKQMHDYTLTYVKSESPLLKVPPIFSYLPALRKVAENATNGLGDAVLVSNNGQLILPEGLVFKPTTMNVGVNSRFLGYTFWIGVQSVASRLCFTLLYTEPLVLREDGEKFVKGFTTELMKLTAAQSSAPAAKL